MSKDKIHASHPSFNKSLLSVSPEKAVAEFVACGDLSVDVEGRVWRLRRKVGGSYPRMVELGSPVRAENVISSGRHQVQVYILGERVVCLAARLIWYLNNGEIPARHHIHHLNEDVQDNRPRNLQCLPGATHISTHNIERQQELSDVYEQQRYETWQLWKSGRTYNEVAEILGITRVGVAGRLRRYREDHNIQGRNHKANLRKVLKDDGVL